MPDTLDATTVRRWSDTGLLALRAHQREIDALNVYPVPDGDTGTNLVLTLTSAHHALAVDFDNSPEGAQTEHGHALRLLARGALLGARGNSGVIIAQILRGLAEAVADVPAVRGRHFAAGLRAATTAAYAAVAEPVEGTILSVLAAAADGAAAADSDDLVEVARAAATASALALARTPEQLPVLARAGVVDAGGRGLCLLLDALVDALTGTDPVDPGQMPAVEDQLAHLRPRSAGDTDFAYEVQFLVDAEEAAVEQLKRRLLELGDSLVVVGAGRAVGKPQTWNVHVHVNDIGAAIEAGVVAGRPHQISVIRFEDQLSHGQPGHAQPAHAQPAHAQPAHAQPGQAQAGQAYPGWDQVREDRVAGGPPSPAARPGRVAVVVADGMGLAVLFAREGAAVVRANPSTEEILAAIWGSGAEEAVVLPNDASAQAVASAAAREAIGSSSPHASVGRGTDDGSDLAGSAGRETGMAGGRESQAGSAGRDAGPAGSGRDAGQVGRPTRVSVVPTRSPVQALAALAVREQTRTFDEDVIAMAEAAGACRSAEVCYASREALTLAGRCRAGDVLALIEGEVNLIGTDLIEVSRALLDRMLGGGGELVTLLLGVDAPAGLDKALREHAAQAWPFVEVRCYDGGQPVYPLLIGVE